MSAKGKEELPKIVVMGGSSAPCLIAEGLGRRRSRNLTAIVVTTDTGSSTGVIRRSFSIPGTGDLRAVISKMSGLRGPYSLLRELFEYRIRQEVIKDLNGMAFGNLFIAALSELRGDFSTAIEEACKLLRVVGKVLPVTSEGATLAAVLDDGREVLGEEEVRAPGKGRIQSVYIHENGVFATRACIDAISEADLIVMGPGCLYTSTLACLVVKGVREAISSAKGKKVYICNTTTTPGQTDNYSIVDHVKEVINYLGEGVLEWVLVNERRPPEDMIRSYMEEGVLFLPLTDDQRSELAGLGPKPIFGDFIERGWKGIRKLHKKDTIRHDPKRVVKALLRLLCIFLAVISFIIPIQGFSHEGPRKPPHRLVDENGAFQEGWYSAPIREINIDDARFEGGMEGEDLLKPLRKNTILIYTVNGVEALLTMRMKDAGYMGDFSCLIYEKRKRNFVSYRFRSLLSRGISISPDGIEGISRFANDKATITFLNDDLRNAREINGLITADRGKPSFLCNLKIRYGMCSNDPLVLVRKLPGGRGQYLHRVVGIPVEGRFILGNNAYYLSVHESSAMSGYEAGYHFYKTEWVRASGWGKSLMGDRIGFDLTLHRDGKVEGESTFYWINGRIFRAKGLKMEMDTEKGKTKIFTGDGKIRLLFYHHNSCRDSFNFGPIQCQAFDIMGSFVGDVEGPKGTLYRVKDISGHFEEWKARW